MRRLKILLSASACHPTHGSEPGVGWRMALLLAEKHDVWVLTHAHSEQDILAAQRNGQAQNIHFRFLGKKEEFHRNPLIARLQTWKWYSQFQREALVIAKDLHSQVGFDLAHHVTISTWRVASPLWQLPIPFIWGPVGGCGRMPFRFYGSLSPGAILFELARELSTLKSSLTPAVVKCVKNSTVVVASNEEARSFLFKFRNNEHGLRQLLPIYFTEETLQRFSPKTRKRNDAGPLRIFAGGFFIGTKGISLALRALACAKARHVDFQYVIAGCGSEIPALKKLTKQLRLEECVTFKDGYRGEEYVDALNRADIFLLPSFRENVGITMMEAMLCGCVPIVAGISAQGEIVDNSCGFRIPPTSSSSMWQGMADVICQLHLDRKHLFDLGQIARQRIALSFTETIFNKRLDRIYSQALSGHSL